MRCITVPVTENGNGVTWAAVSDKKAAAMTRQFRKAIQVDFDTRVVDSILADMPQHVDCARNCVTAKELRGIIKELKLKNKRRKHGKEKD